jgi:hypothetical protein
LSQRRCNSERPLITTRLILAWVPAFAGMTDVG